MNGEKREGKTSENNKVSRLKIKLKVWNFSHDDSSWIIYSLKKLEIAAPELQCSSIFLIFFFEAQQKKFLVIFS